MIGVPSVSRFPPCDLEFNADSNQGAFVAAPIGGLLWGFGAFALRVSVQWILAKVRGHHFDAFDRSPPPEPSFFTGGRERSSGEEDGEPVADAKAPSVRGKFL